MGDAAEIIKSGAFEKVADLIHKLAGPLSEELGLAFGDKARAYRVKNLVKIAAKTRQFITDAKREEKPVPSRLFLPIFEASSLEDDETLQTLWAGLLASSSAHADRVSPAFIETLKQLTPDDARGLHKLYTLIVPSWNGGGSLGSMTVVQMTLFDLEISEDPTVLIESFERLGLIAKRYNLRGKNNKLFASHFGQLEMPGVPLLEIPYPMKPLNLLNDDDDDDLPELEFTLEWTSYGLRFMKACIGPEKIEPAEPVK